MGLVTRFEVHLVKLKEHRFLDLYLIDAESDDWEINPLAGFSLIMRPGHMFMKVTAIEPELQLAFLDPDWLDRLLTENPKAIRHERVRLKEESGDGKLILTASTKQLQKFILKHANDEKAFGSPSSMKRKIAPIGPAEGQ